MSRHVLPVRKPKVVWAGRMPRTAQDDPITPLPRPDDRKHELYKLVLVVAEACNLRCTYCYAEGGPYGRNVSLMSEATARTSMREMFSRYRIRTLQFFGGEPTLNVATMRAAVDEVNLMVKERIVPQEPQYSIVTNGTRMTPDLLSFYKETGMEITVSHDGPKVVQDELRPNSGGRGSFARVEETLSAFRDAGLSFDVQCTYTRKHLEAGLRIPDLMEWFSKRGAKIVHIVPVSVPEGDPLDVWFGPGFDDMVAGFVEGVHMTFAALDDGQPTRLGMVLEAAQLLQKGKTESPHYCNAGVTTLTVAANGEVYPCFMFINKKGFVLGHAGEGHSLGAFSRNPEDGVDFGCPGREFMMSGEIRTFQRDEQLKRAVVGAVLECLDSRLTQLESSL